MVSLLRSALIKPFRGVSYAQPVMPRLTYPKRRAIKQALEMQESFAKCMKVLEADFLASTEKEERARLATAMGGLGRNWTALQETIRILKGQPLPGSLTYEKVKKVRAPERAIHQAQETTTILKRS